MEFFPNKTWQRIGTFTLIGFNHAITCHHVICQPTLVKGGQQRWRPIPNVILVFCDDSQQSTWKYFRAKIVRFSKSADIAILKIVHQYGTCPKTIEEFNALPADLHQQVQQVDSTDSTIPPPITQPTFTAGLTCLFEPIPIYYLPRPIVFYDFPLAIDVDMKTLVARPGL